MRIGFTQGSRATGWLKALPLAVGMAFLPVAAHAEPADYAALVSLFHEWRIFEHPVLRNGVADYTAPAMAAKARDLAGWQQRLAAIDPSGWPIAQQNDYKLVKAEMNGLDYDIRVLRPWARDPAFYVSVWAHRTDVPGREAPAAYPQINLYDYRFPLSAADQKVLAAQLAAIPAFLDEARDNLKDSNARDLWIYGPQELRNQSQALADWEAGTLTVSTLEGDQHADLKGTSPALRQAVANARKATEGFIAWLQAEAPKKTGPSGVGKENYTWYQRNVHFVPYSWDEEVALLQRELARAQASLRLEEHNNRNLPPLLPAPDAKTFDPMAREHLDYFVNFLVKHEIIPEKPYLKQALIPQISPFVPEDKRVFFTRIIMREPMLLYSHDYHWIDLARMRDEPNPDPIRRGALLSNIWDGRAEGFATAFEELLMHAGLYDNNPRAKELVWIMLANRAARGLASLYVQANMMNLDQAGKFHASWTPGNLSTAGDELTAFEQLLYLRHPGYGTSYIIGKMYTDRLMAEYSHQQEQAGKPFTVRDFMGKFNDEGMIPIPLMETEMVAPESRLPLQR